MRGRPPQASSEAECLLAAAGLGLYKTCCAADSQYRWSRGQDGLQIYSVFHWIKLKKILPTSIIYPLNTPIIVWEWQNTNRQGSTSTDYNDVYNIQYYFLVKNCTSQSEPNQVSLSPWCWAWSLKYNGAIWLIIHQARNTNIYHYITYVSSK